MSKQEVLLYSATPQIPPTENLQVDFSEQDGLDTANSIDSLLRLRSRRRRRPSLSNVDRILDPPEVQMAQLPYNQGYLEKVNRLQSFWDFALGKSDSVIKNYNPVLERARYESLETVQEREQFKGQYSFNQTEKALRERFNVAASVVIYDFDQNGKLVSRDMPNQTFEQVLDVGIEYYQQENPQDVSRMKKEKMGVLKVQDEFYKEYKDKSKKPEIKADIVSGKGLVEGTIFIDNFLDRWEVLEDPLTRLRYVQMTRFTTDTSYDQYREMIAAKLPGYAISNEIPIDEHFLSTPIFNKEGLLIQRATSLNESEFQQIVKDGDLGMSRLGEAITAPIFNPRKVVEILNTVLNGADYAWAKIMKIKDKVVDSVKRVVDKISSWSVPVFRTFEEKVDWFKKIAVRAVAAGCGLSGGYSLGGTLSTSFLEGAKGFIKGLFGGSVEGSRILCCTCPFCGKQVEAKIANGTITCPNPDCNRSAPYKENI